MTKSSLITVCSVALIFVVTAASSFAQTFTVLALFDARDNGAFPQTPLVQGIDGNLYGTAKQVSNIGGASLQHF